MALTVMSRYDASNTYSCRWLEKQVHHSKDLPEGHLGTTVIVPMGIWPFGLCRTNIRHRCDIPSMFTISVIPWNRTILVSRWHILNKTVCLGIHKMLSYCKNNAIQNSREHKEIRNVSMISQIIVNKKPTWKCVYDLALLSSEDREKQIFVVISFQVTVKATK